MRRWPYVVATLLVAALALTADSAPQYVTGDVFVATSGTAVGRVSAGASGTVLTSNGTATLPSFQTAPGASSAPTGSLMMWPSSSAPPGSLLCDGSAVSRGTYSALFAVVGETFGPGDGSSTFNLPDLRGRVPVGFKGTDTDFDAVGETGGAKTVSAGTPVGTVAWPAGVPTFSGSALSTHQHGVGTYVPSAHSGTAVADHASHTHTYTEVPNHVHVQNINTATTGGAVGWPALQDNSTSGSGATGVSTANPTGGVATGTTAGPSATLTHSVTQPSAHTMSGSSEAVSAGTPAGTVAWPAGVPTYTGGALSATSVVQPYIAVYFIIKQ